MGHAPVRWGLLSTARINERLIPAMRSAPRSELLAVASQGGRDKADRYAATWNIPRACGSYEELLADREIDAVYISLPNSLHREWTIAAARAGKHVLCEKPLATTVAEVDEMAEAARRHGVVLQEAVMMRFHPQTRELQQRLAAGAIGDIRLVRGVFSFNLDRPGDIRLDAALGGGSIWDLGSYPVSFMRTMLRAEPVEVHGWHALGALGADLSFAGHLRFASGAMTQFFSSFQAAPFAQVDILGSKGQAIVDVPYLNKVGISTQVRIWRTGASRAAGTFSDSPANIEEELLTFDNVNAYQNEVDSMVASILNGAEPVVPLSESRGNVATLAALCASAQTGAAVRL
ncbi:MAG: Gfo/Idh/MocA family oxidoreductase [Planctomycetia bacterium]|nr:Gfo/Idh/MocA family oxidoreductase [Planctomycetia bacterium]